MTETVGVCKFCGQVYQYDESLELTEDELNENATMRCSCRDAKAYNEKITTKDRLKKYREEEILRGSLQIEELFGEGATKYGLESTTSDIIDLLNTIIVLVIDDELKSVSINISSKTKVSITKSAKSKVSITRTDNATFKKEV